MMDVFHGVKGWMMTVHDRRRVLVMANPAAGGGGGRARLERVVRLMERRGAEVEIRPTSTGEGVSFPDRCDLDCDVAVAAGGDGTLHLVANEFYRKNLGIPLAFLPLGTANVFSFEAGLPGRDEALAQVILAGDVRDYRPGLATVVSGGEDRQRIFMLMAGIGWDARVTLAVEKSRRKGKASYLVAGLGLMASGKMQNVRLRAGEAELEGEAVVVANSPFYAGPFCLVPGADHRRDELSVAVVAKVSFVRVIRLGWHALRKEPERSGNVRYLDAPSVEIASAGIPVQMDGEAAGVTPAVFGKAPRCLRVVFPPSR